MSCRGHSAETDNWRAGEGEVVVTSVRRHGADTCPRLLRRMSSWAGNIGHCADGKFRLLVACMPPDTFEQIMLLLVGITRWTCAVVRRNLVVRLAPIVLEDNRRRLGARSEEPEYLIEQSSAPGRCRFSIPALGIRDTHFEDSSYPARMLLTVYCTVDNDRWSVSMNVLRS